MTRRFWSFFWCAAIAATGTMQGEDFALFYALDADLAALKADAGFAPRSLKVGATSIQEIRVNGNRVFAAKMGVGNTTTAINVTALLSKFACDYAISIGPAGALTDKAIQNQWYVISAVTGYQRGTFGKNGWEISPMAKIQMPIPEFAKGFAQDLSVKNMALASGDAFVTRANERCRIHEISRCDLVDMNSFGLANACIAARVPLLVLRVVSDEADENADERFRAFASSYDGEGGAFVLDLLRNLPPSPTSIQSYKNIRRELQ